jgi:hypothetical protein
MSRRKRNNLVRTTAPKEAPRPTAEPLLADIDREWARLLLEAS